MAAAEDPVLCAAAATEKSGTRGRGRRIRSLKSQLRLWRSRTTIADPIHLLAVSSTPAADPIHLYGDEARKRRPPHYVPNNKCMHRVLGHTMYIYIYVYELLGLLWEGPQV